jgi:hypothetical protein
MISPHYILAKPHDGKMYDNVRSNGLIVSSSMEDHTVTNRLADVISLPHGYDGEVRVGDTLVVHHNVFRTYYDMKGKSRKSYNYVKDDIYYIEDDFFYMYIRDGKFYPKYPFVFVRPVANEKELSVYSTGSKKPLVGELAYVNDRSGEEGLSVGDVVSFKPDSEYVFRINDEKLYRMYQSSIVAKL